MLGLILLAGFSMVTGSSELCGVHSDVQINVCRSSSEVSFEPPTPSSSSETGDGITVIDGLLSDSERGRILDDLPFSKQPRNETHEIDAPEGLAHGISMGFLEAETGAQRRAKQIEKLRDGARRDGTGNASMSRTSLLVTAQSFSVDYHREEGCDGHAGLLYIGGSGMLEFMNPASNDTVHSVEIVPGRMVAWHNNKWDHRAIASNQTRIFVALCSRGRGTFSSTTITGYCQYPAPGYVCPCNWTEKNPPVTAGCFSGTGPGYLECFPHHCCDLGGNNTCPTTTPNATVEATTTAATVPSVGAAGASTTASSGANATGMYTGYEFCTTAAACFFNAYTKGTHYKIHKSSASYPAASCAADCVADAECEAFESLSGGTAPSCSFWKNGACDIQAGTSPGPPGYTTSIPYATFCDKNGARKAFTPVVGKCREGSSLGLSSVALTSFFFLAASRFDE